MQQTQALVENVLQDEMRYIGRVQLENGFIPCGAPTKNTVEDLVDAVMQHVTSHATAAAVQPVQTASVENMSQAYLSSFQKPLDSANWHLWKGAGQRCGEVSVIDWFTFLPTETHAEVLDTLFHSFINSEAVEQVRQRKDIVHAVRTHFPVLGVHGLTSLLETRVWRHLKTHNRKKLGLDSQQAIQNGRNGRSFEQFFQHLCNENGLDCTPYSTAMLGHVYPEIEAKIRAERGHMRGVPDFFVDKGTTHTLHTWSNTGSPRVWEPQSRYAFVEVKYNESPLSKDQKDMIQRLTEHGIEVYVFKGAPEEYRFLQA